jgi:hypothetical protein
MSTPSPKAPWHAEVASDVFAGPLGDDGHPTDALAFYILLTNEEGYRYRSRRVFVSMHRGQLDEATQEARAHLSRVRKALVGGASPVENPKWQAHHPVYGSTAYAVLDQEAEYIALERKEDGV